MARQYKKGDYFKKIKGRRGRKYAWTDLVTFSGGKYLCSIPGQREKKAFNSYHGAKNCANSILTFGHP